VVLSLSTGVRGVLGGGPAAATFFFAGMRDGMTRANGEKKMGRVGASLAAEGANPLKVWICLYVFCC
jgi:hypothetical protein